MATKKDISYWGISCERDEPMFDSYGGSCIGEMCEREVCGAMLAELSFDFVSQQPWDLWHPCLLKAMGSDTHSCDEVGVKMEPRCPCRVIAD